MPELGLSKARRTVPVAKRGSSMVRTTAPVVRIMRPWGLARMVSGLVGVWVASARGVRRVQVGWSRQGWPGRAAASGRNR
ncbi:hypothetical protein BCD48_42635 [Pseudofrankia sp. BMG5.36]|nr:hypothetical protein BCD48_42635 [Pseudofrankia sp. BMG5.36]